MRIYRTGGGMVAEIGDSAGDGCDCSKWNAKAGLGLASKGGDWGGLGQSLKEGSHFQ